MNRDLTRGPVMGSMLLFAVPMILGNLLQQCYNIADTLIVGKYLGSNALAAVGSMLYFSNYPGVVPTSGGMPGLKAFVAAVFGGIGSIPGAVVGAFIIGICENIIKGLDIILKSVGVLREPLELATFSDAFTFVLLIVILVFKPTGLFGEKTTDKV